MLHFTLIIVNIVIPNEEYVIRIEILRRRGDTIIFLHLKRGSKIKMI